jgi:MerR HTH family regulatory protein
MLAMTKKIKYTSEKLHIGERVADFLPSPAKTIKTGFMNKEEAAAYLGTSTRTLERYRKRGLLDVAYKNSKTRPIAIYSREALDKIKIEYADDAKQPLPVKRTEVDLPDWMANKLDKIAHQLGITRQAIIKLWVAEKLISLGIRFDE